MLDIIWEEAWKAIHEYWQTVSILLCFGVASAVLFIVDDDAGELQGFGVTLLIAVIALTILAVGFLAVRVFQRMRE